MPDARPDVEITLTLDADTADLLSVLREPWMGNGLASVVSVLMGFVRDGIRRPGAWEREWLCHAFGHDWIERLERDPEVSHHDRPKRDDP